MGRMFAKIKFNATIHFTSVYLAFLGCAIFVQQFLPGYLRYASIEAISYRMEDGWCDPKKDGIGTHCFGDFYYPLTFVDLDNPWRDVVNPYPPISLLLYKPFSLISDVSFPRVALSLFLITLLLSLVFPVLHLRFVAKEISVSVFAVLVLVTLLCAPALMSLDRGNNQLMLTPFLYLFIRHCMLQNHSNIMMYGLFCVLLKPQMIFLVILIYQIVGLKKTCKWLFGVSIIYALSFLIYFRSFPMNILEWLYRALTFQDYAGRGILMPVNVSISSDIDVLLNIANLEVSRNSVKLFVYLLMGGFTYLLLRNLRTRSYMHNFILILFYPLLFTGTAFHYYLCLLYIPFIYHFASQIQSPRIGSIKLVADQETSLPTLSSTLPGFTFLLFTITAFIPWGIPWSALFPSLRGRGWDVIGVNWIFAQYALLIFAIVMILHYPKTGSVRINGKVKS